MLQTFLSFRVCQNLGYLSFGIYTMHIIIKDSLLDPIIHPWTVTVFGDKWFGSTVARTLNTIAVFWAADYFARVDGLLVKAGRWVEECCFLPVER